MTNACRRCVVVLVGSAWLWLAAGCSDDDPTLESREVDGITADTAPPGSGQGGDSTASELAAATKLGSYILFDADFGTEVTVTVAQGLRTIETNAIPDHETGQFPNAGNPNTISGQALRYEFPTNPRLLGRATPAGTPGVAINGVPFEPGTAETVECQSGERYQIEGLQRDHDLGLDANNAHVQPTGKYHYHGLAAALVDEAGTGSGDDAGGGPGAGLVHIGFAADGHLIYAAGTTAHLPSYRLVTEPRTGTGCTYRGGAIEIDGTTPDGTYVSDWVFDDTLGTLDACNGTTIDDEYLYFVTERYPYVPRCLMGDFTDPGPTGPAPAGGRDGGEGGGDGAGPSAGDDG